MKRVSFGLIAVLVLAIAMAMACARPTPKPAATPTPRPLKVGLVLPGPISDPGWIGPAYNGVKQAAEKYKFEWSYAESVLPPDFEVAFRDYAQKGFTLVIGHGEQFAATAQKVAPEFPQATFMTTATTSAALTTTPPNYIAIDFRAFDTAFPLGVLSGLVTKTNTVGVVSSIKLPTFERGIKQWTEGAKWANPKVKVLTTYTGDLDDTAKAKEAAFGLIAQGADVLLPYGNLMMLGVAEAVREKGVYLTGPYWDMHPVAAQNVLSSSTSDIEKMYDWFFEQFLAGKLRGGPGGRFAVGVREGIMRLVPWYDEIKPVVSESVRAKVDQTVNDIAAGKILWDEAKEQVEFK